jgi:hypothetical protein
VTAAKALCSTATRTPRASLPAAGTTHALAQPPMPFALTGSGATAGADIPSRVRWDD